MTRTIVGVLRGGTSSEYDLSLRSGAAVLSALPEDRYETRDILIDKTGLWHIRGTPATPPRALAQVDVVVNALHGGVGEDGTVARLLERAGVPYTGARPTQLALSLHKVRTREVLRKAGIRMPRAYVFSLHDAATTADMARAVFAVFPPPYVVKPPAEGASQGIRIAPGIIDLPDAIGDVLDAYGTALVEEFIRGEEATVAVVEGFRNQELYALPPAHVIHASAVIIEPHMHRDALIEYRCPGHFSYGQKTALEEAARAAHRALGLRHFSRADMIMTPRRIYVLEVNALPGLYPGAALPPMLESVGSSTTQFVEHAIHLAQGHA